MSAANSWRSPERDKLLPRLWEQTIMSADAIAVEMNRLPGKLLDGRMTCRYAGKLGAKRSREFLSAKRTPATVNHETEYRHLIKPIVMKDESVDAASVASWAFRNNVKPDLDSVNEKRRRLGLPGFSIKAQRVDLRLHGKAA